MAIRTTDSLDEGRITFREPDGGKKSAARAQVTDPVCGMDVDPQSPDVLRSDRNGTTYYFCSAECKQTFEKNPEQFITSV